MTTSELTGFVTVLGGLLLLLGSFGVAAWRIIKGRRWTWNLILVLALAGFIGVALVINQRVTELSFGKVATLKAVVSQAETDSKQISAIRERIEGQSATVDAVAKQAAEAKLISEEVQKRNQQADEKLKTLDEALKRGNEAIVELQSYTTFNNTVLAAQNDDRRAFDQLEAWAEDSKKPFAKAAQQAWVTVFDAYPLDGMFRGGYTIPWNTGVDPAKLSLEEVKAVYQQAPPQIHLALVEFVWETREDIPKRDRMQFLVDVLQKDSSLKVIALAGRYFSHESRSGAKPLAIKFHLDWWEKNKDSIKE